MKKLFFLSCLAFVFTANAQTVTIPVVFHVVYKTPAQNIDDSCLMQQLTVLNEDYNKQNADTAYIPPAWQPIAANLGIQFVLASSDPNGNPTTGIERAQTTVNSFSTGNQVKYAMQGGLNAWPDSVYLNIWVCNLGGGLLGYSSFPGGPDSDDGVVLHYACTGLTCALPYAPFSKGRTATYEVGHWLGMRSMVGSTSCIDNDTIADTPSMQSDPLGYTAPFTVINDACQPYAPGTMWMNFMTYANDSCKYFFTNGQKAVAWYVLNNYRMGLLSSVNNLQGNSFAEGLPVVYPSPSNGQFFLAFPKALEEDGQFTVHNALGMLVYSAHLDARQKTEFSFDLSGQAAGLYFVTVNAGNVQHTQRIVLR